MVGIIANPSSGKDIRRLVAQGTVFDNMEKVNIIQRVLVVLHHAGVKDVQVMPDSFDILEKAIWNLEKNLKIKVKASLLEMRCKHNQDDSTCAAGMFRDMNASCIITLGGDGTNRAVAKACGDVPLIPLSTGTNNVFPKMMEGTVAGLAAAVADKDTCGKYLALERTKKLHILKNGELVDIALVDAAVTADRFIGSRALWRPEDMRELFVTSAKADSIGMSAIAGSFHPMSESDPGGLYVEIGSPEKFKVSAAIAPGLIEEVPIRSHKRLEQGERIIISTPEGMVALDGEREVHFGKDDLVEIGLDQDGPLVINVAQTLEAAARDGLFTHSEEVVSEA